MNSLTLPYCVLVGGPLLLLASGAFYYYFRRKACVNEAHYRNIAEAALDAILLSKGGIIVDCNQRALELTGYGKQELLGKRLYDLFELRFQGLVRANVESGFEKPYEVSGIRKNGEVYMLEVRGKTFDSCGQSIRASSLRDISARKHEEASLRKLSAAVEHSPASIVITDSEGAIEYVNPAFCRLTGYRQEEVLGNTPRILKAGDHSDEFYRELWDTLKRSEEWHGEFHNKRKDGSTFWEMASISPIFDDHGMVSHFVAVKEDITERKELRDRLEQMAQFDMLTGLPNRRMFLDRLGQSVAIACRSKQHFAMLFVDLDGFKRINDTYGHDAGDRVLKTVAARLSACVRISDMVGRMGGDEFTVLLMNLTNSGDAGQVAEKILATLHRPITLASGRQDIIGASIGISVFPEDAHDGDGLLIAADNAMYEVKRSGKNGYRFCRNDASNSDW